MKKEKKLQEPVMHLTFSLPSKDMSESLVTYLHRHGFDAGHHGTNEVTCHLSRPKAAVFLYQLVKNWQLWWASQDSEEAIAGM